MQPSSQQQLLAIDLGLCTGMAIYGEDGQLQAYRSHHFSSITQLRRAAQRILAQTHNLAWIITEGDVGLAAVWERAAWRLGIRVQRVSAETWREALLLPRERQNALLAKRHAIVLAKRIIQESQAPQPTAMRHDTAEAICVGHWAVAQLGWSALGPGASRPTALLRQAIGA